MISESSHLYSTKGITGKLILFGEPALRNVFVEASQINEYTYLNRKNKKKE